MMSWFLFAPGREGIGIGNARDLQDATACLGRRTDIGVLSPRRRPAALVLQFRRPVAGGSSLTLAGRTRCFVGSGRPALFGVTEGGNSLPQGGARPIVRKAGAHGARLNILSRGGFRAQRAACHHVNSGSFTHG